MGFFQIRRSQKIITSPDTLWEFIATPKNLKEITPGYMRFDILSTNIPERIYSGMLITYKVRPILHIPTKWVTEITHVEEKKYFVDEQRVGPYAMWHHQHFVKPIKDGVLMDDIVSYRPPMGFLGNIANSLIIKSKLTEIFDFRNKALEEKFGKFTD